MKTAFESLSYPSQNGSIGKINNRCWRGWGQQKPFGWEWNLVQHYGKSVWGHLKTLRGHLPYDPSISPLGRSTHHGAVCTPVFTALFSIAKLGNQPQCPTAEKLTQCSVQARWTFFPAFKSDIISFVGKWMQPEAILLSKLSWFQKDKYHMLSLICGS